MLEVVSEKTGYPVDMLELSMNMESELGIDSIKRVEILSGMREQAPDLPEVDTAKMATLQTLQEIVDYMGGEVGSGGATVEETPETEAPTTLLPSAEDLGVAGPVDGDAPTRILPPTATAPPEAPAMGRFTVHAVPAPPTGLGMPGLARARKAVVTQEVPELTVALLSELEERGLSAVASDQIPDDADLVIYLGGLKEVIDLDEAEAINRRAFEVARSIAPRFTEQGGVFVTVQDTGGDFGLSASFVAQRAPLGGLAGLAKTAAQEWPDAAVKAIDIERGPRLAQELAFVLAEEIWSGGGELEVGLRVDGQRTTLETRLEAVDGDLPDTSPVAHDQSVIVASGGGRGVTAATLIALAEQSQARFVVLGRTPLAEEPASCQDVPDGDIQRALLADAKAAGESLTPVELKGRASKILAAREVRGTLAALAAAGSEARYVAADVQDRRALGQALDDIRQTWGPITGIVHGAGVIADKMIAEKTPEQFDRVFDTKVKGLRALLDVTADDPLTMICLFSSVSARCGNQGQCDYAMANEVLNKMAAAERRRRGDACVVKSLNWGPWESGMVTPGLKAHFEAQGVPLIPLAVGARMMLDELLVADPTVTEVVLGGEPTAGPLLAGTGAEDVLRMDARVSARTHGFLEDHSIQGAPVLPVVLTLEWFSRLAALHRPGHRVTAVRDLKVLNGIRLDNFYGAGDGFQLESRAGDGGRLTLQLNSLDGRPRYKATVEVTPLGTAPSAPEANGAGAIDALEPWPEPSIYGDVLFHGPDFQVIENLEGISEEGMAAELRGVHAMGWEEDWNTDPALLDGGLQLAVLWFKRRLGGASLPMGIGAYHHYADPTDQTVRAVLHSRVADKDRTVADIVFLENGVLLAELRDVQIYRRPDVAAPVELATA